jgi:uncharacterized protein
MQVNQTPHNAMATSNPEATQPSPVTVRVHDTPTTIDAAGWAALIRSQAHPTPFMGLPYLRALHESGSATEATGWTPQFLTVNEGEQLIGACALYLKTHSYGEYVFDWAWADAYQRHGLRYYPKLLNAVPFTPVPGSRLLARDEPTRALLLQAIGQLAREAKLSSAHLLFLDTADQAAAREAGWMMRSGVQFHWSNRAQNPYADFNEFVHSLQREKRKKILQERRRVNDAGIQFETLEGSQISEADWDYFHRCYTLTYQAHHSTPYLNRDFFARMASNMPEHWLMFMARRGHERVGVSLIAVDAGERVAWGRYWGATEQVNCLHFEACYYQPLAWCINRGYQRFEGGAQGEHKMARGLLPVATASAHWLAHPQFAEAVADFLQREGTGVAEYMNELNERRPFRATP